MAKAPFYKPADDTPEMQYLHARREALGGYVPSRPGEVPDAGNADARRIPPVHRKERRPRSLDHDGVRHADVGRCSKDKKIGKYIVPIVPDESRTFGMEPLFRQCGIYAHVGQLYEPVDSDQLLYYREAEGRPDSGRRDHRGRLDVVVHRRRHGVFRRTACR